MFQLLSNRNCVAALFFVGCFVTHGNLYLYGQVQLKSTDDPLAKQANSVINNATFGTFELKDNTGRSTVNKQDFTAKQGIIILNNGGRIAGYITPHEHGYRISYNNGNQIIPFEYIKCVGNSMDEIYEKLKSETSEPTIADHIRLARQCHTWGYKAGAVEQLKMAMLKDENHPDIRQLAEFYLVDEKSDKVQQASSAQMEDRKTTLQISKYRELHKIPSNSKAQLPPLPGLDHEKSQEFNSSIQPILQARCGNARCHGGVTTRSFHVDWIARDRLTSRKRVEDNLRSFLNQVDRDTVAESPILKTVLAEDGAHGSNLWKDASAQKNKEVLFDYVYSLSKNPGKQKSSQTELMQAKNAPDLQAVPGESQNGMIRDSNITKTSGIQSLNSDRSSNIKLDQAWDKYKQQREHDQFDPEEFNRMK